MPGGPKASRAPVWADNLGDWTWPGRAASAILEPPSWVPARPPRQRAAVGAHGDGVPSGPLAGRARTLLIGVLLSALAAVCMALVVQGRTRTAQGSASAGTAASPA